ncbi:hypothetical protein PAI11_33220 [Patulibacter medicamentivorans]|uniref:Uncharacterized protein n=1 Tax=Patulibacter medicamentivorans TaxID=1097667 RepID=H0E907_9ACTN|nr:hypothetical protein PAI11_33220 [Patulibacter medicamentivorans]
MGPSGTQTPGNAQARCVERELSIPSVGTQRGLQRHVSTSTAASTTMP